MRSSRFKRSFPRSREGWMGRSLRSKLLNVDLVFSRTAVKLIRFGLVSQLFNYYFSFTFAKVIVRFSQLVKVIILTFLLSSASGRCRQTSPSVVGRWMLPPVLRLPPPSAKVRVMSGRVRSVKFNWVLRFAGGSSCPCREGRAQRTLRLHLAPPKACGLCGFTQVTKIKISLRTLKRAPTKCRERK